MRQLMLSSLAIAIALSLLGMYLYFPSQNKILVEAPQYNVQPNVPVETSAANLLVINKTEGWTGGSAREFIFNCTPGNKATFTLITVREGTPQEIISAGQATIANPKASLPAKCFFGANFDCTYFSFGKNSFTLRLKNMAMSDVAVKKFTMSGSTGQECSAI